MSDSSTTHDVSRRGYVTAVGAGGLTLLAGCSGIRGNQGDADDDSLTKLGFTSYVRGGSWITAYLDATRYYCNDTNIQLDVRPNRQSAAKQVQAIRSFAALGYDGILVGVWSTGAVKSAIDYAKDQGVPVIATNSDTASANSLLYVGFSNYQGGKKSAVRMYESLNTQNQNNDQRVINVRGPYGKQSANNRSQGFVEYMERKADVTIEKTIVADNAQDVAQTKVQQYIQANGAVDGIYSANLSMGLGVVGALRKLDLLHKTGADDHIVLTQMDGSPQVNPLISEGYIDAAVDQPNYFYNPIAIKYMQQYIEAGGADGNGQSVLPTVGETITKNDLNIKSHKHKGVQMWKQPIWAPATIKEQNGHPWFQTDSIVIDQKNADNPYLWGNIWGGD